MQTNDKYDIKQEIEHYFKQHALGDIPVYGNSFTMMCPYIIWKSVHNHAQQKRVSIAKDNSIEEVLKKIKELTGKQTLNMETSCGLFYIVTLSLTNATWYLHKCPCGYDSRPLSRYGTTSGTTLSAQEGAELIIEFDKWIPHILERAEAAILQKQERTMMCEILKTSALAIINQLIADGAIAPPSRIDVRCARPDSIEIHVEKKPILMVKSLEELPEKLIEKYPAKQK